MLSEQIRLFRKQKGFTQEELAIRANVVRQTISKWEKGISVPDAEMLIRVSEIFEISVSELLGSKIENETDRNDIAEQLSRINEKLAIKNKRGKLIIKIIIGIIIGIILFNILLIVVNIVSFSAYKTDKDVTVTNESEVSLPVE